MSFILFMIMSIVAVVVVRVGSVILQLTGMPEEQSFFQALSCFTGCGFTTGESELITRHQRRRRIAQVLMILGYVGSITLIATLATHIQRVITGNGEVTIPFTDYVLFTIDPTLLASLKLVLVTITVYIIYRLFMKSKLSHRLLDYIKHRLRQMKIFQPLTYEELVAGIGGYDIIKMRVSRTSKILDKSIEEIKKDHQKLQILTLQRGDQIFHFPPDDMKIMPDDILICFGDRVDALESLTAR